MSDFAGFPQETFQFFEQLAQNNERDWFNAHKQDFIDYVQEPVVEFVAALGPRLQRISPSIQFIPSANRGSLMRIYRDIRFSKDKTPYKTHMGATFWDGHLAKTENPGYFFHIDANNGYLYGGNWMFSKSVLAAYREAIANGGMASEVSQAITAVRSAGDYEVDGDRYKRVPRGYPADHPYANLLLYKGIWSRAPEFSRKEMSSTNFVDICEQHAIAMAPLHHVMLKVHHLTQ